MNHVFLLVGMLSMTFVSCESDQRTENPTGKLDEGSSSESNEETILEEPGSNPETFCRSSGNSLNSVRISLNFLPIRILNTKG